MLPAPERDVPMLTREESIVAFDDASGRAVPDRLSRKTHGHYLTYAQQLLGIYEQGAGLTRRELHRAVENTLARLDDCPQRRVAAFQKLLDDVSELVPIPDAQFNLQRPANWKPLFPFSLAAFRLTFCRLLLFGIGIILKMLKTVASRREET